MAVAVGVDNDGTGRLGGVCVCVVWGGSNPDDGDEQSGVVSDACVRVYVCLCVCVSVRWDTVGGGTRTRARAPGPSGSQESRQRIPAGGGREV